MGVKDELRYLSGKEKFKVFGLIGLIIIAGIITSFSSPSWGMCYAENPSGGFAKCVWNLFTVAEAVAFVPGFDIPKALDSNPNLLLGQDANSIPGNLNIELGFSTLDCSIGKATVNGQSDGTEVMASIVPVDGSAPRDIDAKKITNGKVVFVIPQSKPNDMVLASTSAGAQTSASFTDEMLKACEEGKGEPIDSTDLSGTNPSGGGRSHGSGGGNGGGSGTGGTTGGGGTGGTGTATPECSDGIDNDGDGFIDFRANTLSTNPTATNPSPSLNTGLAIADVTGRTVSPSSNKKPPKDCKLWFDGCNECQVSDDGIVGACTMKNCKTYSQSKCLEFHNPSQSIPPKDCKLWFDGCNECQVSDDGVIGSCTKKFCTSYSQSKCLKYRNPGTQIPDYNPEYCGDIDNDGDIDQTDALLISKSSLGEVSVGNMNCMDVNGDGRNGNILDAQYIARFLSGQVSDVMCPSCDKLPVKVCSFVPVPPPSQDPLCFFTPSYDSGGCVVDYHLTCISSPVPGTANLSTVLPFFQNQCSRLSTSQPGLVTGLSTSLCNNVISALTAPGATLASISGMVSPAIISLASAGDPQCLNANDTSEAAECSNRRDDDNDGRIDYPSDTGCLSINDDNELDNTISGGGTNTTGVCSIAGDIDGSGILDNRDLARFDLLAANPPQCRTLNFSCANVVDLETPAVLNNVDRAALVNWVTCLSNPSTCSTQFLRQLEFHNPSTKCPATQQPCPLIPAPLPVQGCTFTPIINPVTNCTTSYNRTCTPSTAQCAGQMGDINRDNKTDVLDAQLIAVSIATRTVPTDANLKCCYDLNADGQVNNDDALRAAQIGAGLAQVPTSCAIGSVQPLPPQRRPSTCTHPRGSVPPQTNTTPVQEQTCQIVAGDLNNDGVITHGDYTAMVDLRRRNMNTPCTTCLFAHADVTVDGILNQADVDLFFRYYNSIYIGSSYTGTPLQFRYPTANCPATKTQCNDGLDNDIDGLIDVDDFQCKTATGVYNPTLNLERNITPTPQPSFVCSKCSNNIDDDSDGRIDSDDPQCLTNGIYMADLDSEGNLTQPLPPPPPPPPPPPRECTSNSNCTRFNFPCSSGTTLASTCLANNTCKRYSANDCTSPVGCSVGPNTNVVIFNDRTRDSKTFVPNADGSLNVLARYVAQPGDSFNMTINNCVGNCPVPLDVSRVDRQGSLANCDTTHCDFGYNILPGGVCPR